MRWHVLWLSLILSIALAVGLVQGVLMMGMKDQLSLMLPLLPLFNAVIFPVLERLFPTAEQRAEQRMEGRSRRGWTGALDPVIVGFIAGMAVNMALDILAATIYQQMPPSPFSRFLDWARGGFNPFSGRLRLAFLFFELIVVSAFSGLCVGVSSSEQAILGGLLTGALLSLWMGANQYIAVYETISNVMLRFLGKFIKISWEWNYGLVIVLFLQVFLCGVFSGWGYRMKLKISPAK